MNQRSAVVDVPLSYAYIFSDPKKHPLRSKMLKYTLPSKLLNEFV